MDKIILYEIPDFNKKFGYIYFGQIAYAPDFESRGAKILFWDRSAKNKFKNIRPNRKGEYKIRISFDIKEKERYGFVVVTDIENLAVESDKIIDEEIKLTDAGKYDNFKYTLFKNGFDDSEVEPGDVFFVRRYNDGEIIAVKKIGKVEYEPVPVYYNQPNFISWEDVEKNIYNFHIPGIPENYRKFINPVKFEIYQFVISKTEYLNSEYLDFDNVFPDGSPDNFIYRWCVRTDIYAKFKIYFDDEGIKKLNDAGIKIKNIDDNVYITPEISMPFMKEEEAKKHNHIYKCFLDYSKLNVKRTIKTNIIN